MMPPADPQPPGDRPPPGLPMTASLSCWTPARNEIRSWLDRNAPPLAELYTGAVMLLYTTTVPGHVRFVSHAVREIRNRLPDAIAGPTLNQRLDHTSRLDEINALPGTRALIADLGGPTAPATTPLPIDRTLATKIGELLQDHLTTRTKPIDAARRLFQGIAPENTPWDETLNPILHQWLKVTNWFVSKAHVSEHTDDHYSKEDLCHNFTLFENAIAAAITPFFTTLEDLDDILENTNT
jgi:hypothetical protein